MGRAPWPAADPLVGLDGLLAEPDQGGPARTRASAPHFQNASYFTLFIHLRIGPVTESSGVLGENTSDIWL